MTCLIKKIINQNKKTEGRRLGQYFGSKFRAGVMYGIFDSNNDCMALEKSLKVYQCARDSWAVVATLAKDVYKQDITIGEHPYLCGHWLDRLLAISGSLYRFALPASVLL